MKKIKLFVIAFCWMAALAAQPPAAFNYQAVIRHDTGEIIGEQHINLRISIMADPDEIEVMYTEIFETQTNSYGLVNLAIGRGEAIEGDFSEIDWGSQPLYLKIEMDINDDKNFVEMGSAELLSVPYAIYAQYAEAGGEPGPEGPPGQDGVGIYHTIDNEDGTFTLVYTDGTTFTTPDFTGPQGEMGPAGPQGPEGTGISILGSLEDPSELPDDAITGDAYLINGEIWLWNDEEWINAGNIQGPQGLQGETGPMGPAGPAGEPGDDGVGISGTTDNLNGTFTLVYTDGTSFTTSDLTGPQGPQGAQGETGPMGPAGPAGETGTDGVGIAETTDNQDGSFTIHFTDGSSFTTPILTGPQGPQGPEGPEGPAIEYEAGEGLGLDGLTFYNTAPGIEYSAGAGIAIAENVITNTAPDQVVTFSGLSGNATQITGSYPNFSIHTPTITAGDGISITSNPGGTITVNNTAPAADSGITFTEETLTPPSGYELHKNRIVTFGPVTMGTLRIRTEVKVKTGAFEFLVENHFEVYTGTHNVFGIPQNTWVPTRQKVQQPNGVFFYWGGIAKNGETE